jgi:hypothetical protein
MPSGKYKVQILWMKSTGKKVPSGDGDLKNDETKQILPPEFNSRTTLTADIGSGQNTKDFTLPKSNLMPATASQGHTDKRN